MAPRHPEPRTPDPATARVAHAHPPAHDAPPGEGRRLLLALLGAPLAWLVHLSASYVVVALWCANGWRTGTIALLVLTALGVVAALATGVLAWRLWGRGRAHLVGDAEPGVPGSWDARLGERGARIAFLALLALFMSAMFGYLIVLEGLPSLFAPLCHVGSVP
jgi:hypothetical protein